MSSITHVEGFKYVAAVKDGHGFGGRQIRVFIPSYQLDICEDGCIDKTDRHFQTYAGDCACSSWSPTTRRRSPERLRAVRKEADKKALIPIQIPKEMADRIKKALEDSLALKETTTKIIEDSGFFILKNDAEEKPIATGTDPK